MKLKFKHVDQLSNNKKARIAYRVIRLLPEGPVLNAFFDSEDVPKDLELAVRARHKEAEELMNVNLPKLPRKMKKKLKRLIGTLYNGYSLAVAILDNERNTISNEVQQG